MSLVQVLFRFCYSTSDFSSFLADKITKVLDLDMPVATRVILYDVS